ncbi:Clp protease N-terminal domain-containing protein, partial [Aedoeadaptatus coxii]
MAMFGKFTEKSQRAMVFAQSEAREQGHSYIGSEHILLGILKEPGGASNILMQVGVNYERAREAIGEIVAAEDKTVTTLTYTPRTKKIFELALEIANELGHNYIGTEHLLLAILREGKGVAVLALRNLGIDVDMLERSIYEAIKKVDGGDALDGLEEESALEEFGYNLNERAEQGKIDPVIGRQDEIE